MVYVLRANNKECGAMLPTVSLPSCHSSCLEKRSTQLTFSCLSCPQAASPFPRLDGGRLSNTHTGHGCTQVLSPRTRRFAQAENEPSRQTIPSTGPRTATHVRAAIGDGCEQTKEEFHCLPRMQIGKKKGKSPSVQELRPRVIFDIRNQVLR